MSFFINPANNQSNIGATNIGFSKAMKAGYFVVNPANIKPYSFYDDLKKGENFYKDALNIVSNQKTSSSINRKKVKWNKIAGIAFFILTGTMVYKNRNLIVNFLKKISTKK